MCVVVEEFGCGEGGGCVVVEVREGGLNKVIEKVV